MNATLHAVSRTCCFLLLLSLGVPLSGDDSWKAGVARSNITPQQPMSMAGYASRDRPAEGVRTELWAKAIVLEDVDGDRGLLLTLDLVGIDRGLSVSICDQISEKFGLSRKEIAICTSHTHTGPVVGQNLAPMHYALAAKSQQALINDYAEVLQSKIMDAVGRAIGDLEACRLAQGHGVATFAVNRRNNRPEGEVPQRRTAGTLVGPYDHDVPVLSVRSADGELKAVVFGYACHSTVLSDYQWSGDYPGFAQLELERLHPGCQAMFWAGCGADQNPLPRRTAELAQHYGRRLADAVDTVLLTSAMANVAPDIETNYSEIDLELDTLPTRQSLESTVKSGNRFEQSRARMLLAQIEAGKPLAQTYPYPVGVWKLGNDVHFVALGGEVVVDYALRLKSELKGRVWVSGYANDVMAYIPSRRVLREGGYEGATAMIYYGLPTTWAPTIENAIVNEVVRQTELENPSRDDTQASTALLLSPGEGNPRNSEGDFIQLNDGRMLFVYTRFASGGSDHDSAELVCRESSDEGETWSAANTPVIANEGGLNVMSVSLLRLADGRIALFYLRKNSLQDCRPVVRFSSDEAKTWSEPVQIISDDAIGYYVLNNDRVIQLSSGRLVLPVALHHRPTWEKPDWRGQIGCYLSDDAGISWRRSETMQQAHDAGGKRVTAQEPGIIELNDRLLLWVRTDAGEQYRAYSKDSGDTWTRLEPMGIASPLSPASIERIPSTGDLLIVWNNHAGLPIENRKLRTPLSVAISRDDGATWENVRNIDDDPKGWFCYTAIEFTKNHLLLGHVAGQQAPGKHLSTSQITRLPISWLYED
jgi:neutral ceramidase